MTKHSWRPPASSRNKSFNKSNKFYKDERSDRNRWLKFVTDPHLELLMALVDQQRRGKPLSRTDSFHYCAIKEQAEDIMAAAKAEHWSEADKRARMLAWDDAYIVVKR